MPTIRVNLFSPRQALDAVLGRVGEAKSFTLFTLNLDHIVKLRGDPAFRECYEAADFVSADGWPIVWYYRRRGVALERTTGADLVAPLCEKLAERNVPVFFIGPQPHVQAEAIDVLRARYAHLEIAGADSSFISSDDPAALDALARRIRDSGARLCFVCLGAPKREFVAHALKSRCPGVGFLCVGAALDFISGAVVRAPLWVQHVGFEWAWRLMADPRRLAIRYLRCVWVFALMAAHRAPLALDPQHPAARGR